ncbi:MAG: hypothetical protein AAFN70_08070 [Planctomycetota bacterium]
MSDATMSVRESNIEDDLTTLLADLKYTIRDDITDRVALGANTTICPAI